MSEPVKISFEGGSDETAPFVTVYNPRILPGALFSQILRYGLINSRDKESSLSGRLKGNRKAFTEMIQSYGVSIEIVPAAVV